MKFNMVYKTILLVVLCVFVIFLTKRNARSSALSKDILVVGMMSGWPPYMSVDERGKYVGFDVDVANALGKKLGKKVEIRDLGSLSALFFALQQGKIDIIFSGLDITQERQGRMTMVPYTGDDITFLYLVFYDQVPLGIRSLEDLEKIPDVIVCVEANSTSEKLIDNYPKINKRQLKGMADMVFDVRSGKSRAFLAEPAVVRRLLKKEPQLTYIAVDLPKKLCVYGCGIALKKENTLLANAISGVVRDMKLQGELQALETLWNLNG